MIDYTLFYRRSINIDRIPQETEHFDLFVSAFNPSDRITKVFDKICAERKVWLIQPEYQFTGIDLPQDFELVQPTSINEIDQINDLLNHIGSIEGLKICVDVTGFMRHTLLFLTAKLDFLGVRSFEAVYSEPMFYTRQEDTIFSTKTTGVTRPVSGMAGSTNTNGKDFLIIAVGYDHSLVSEVTNHKDNSIVYPLFGFPSLSPDMYQQSAIRSAESGEVTLQTSWTTNRRFAPANDPFSTARSISEIVADIDKKDPLANIYLSPLSTKIQTLGFAIFWCLEGRKRGATTVLIPECSTYSRETSSGLKRLWTFTVELLGNPPNKPR